jgi:hypothetical protein
VYFKAALACTAGTRCMSFRVQTPTNNLSVFPEMPDFSSNSLKIERPMQLPARTIQILACALADQARQFWSQTPSRDNLITAKLRIHSRSNRGRTRPSQRRTHAWLSVRTPVKAVRCAPASPEAQVEQCAEGRIHVAEKRLCCAGLKTTHTHSP